MIPRSRLLSLALVLLAACACGRVSAPLVGISCSQSGTRSDALSRNYPEAILRAGGTPVIIPTLTTEAEAERMLARLDGIVFSGGEDINPGWYGEEPLNETVEVNASATAATACWPGLRSAPASPSSRSAAASS